jgi:hypothetical protein
VPDTGKNGDGRGISGNVIAGGIGSAATLPCIYFGKRYLPDIEPAYWAAIAIILLAVIWAIAMGGRRLLGMIRKGLAERTAPAKGQKLAVYVAKLAGDDAADTARRSVIDSISNEIGKDAIEVLPAGLTLALKQGASEDEAADPAAGKARKLLRRKNGDLLIWGRLHTIAGRGTCIELRFVSAALDGSSGKRFGLVKNNLVLNKNFGPEMAAALASTVAVLALPVTEEAGTYLVPKLAPLADRLGGLVKTLPAAIKAEDRAQIFHAFALINAALGEQTGDSSHLEKAIVAYREALKEYNRERVPLDWAMTQNNLGNALQILGERESGTERLEEAVAAYRQALIEYGSGSV